jgi:prolyl 4-hydroxylase
MRQLQIDDPFIRGYYFDDDRLIDELVELHNSKQKTRGTVGNPFYGSRFNPESKISWDTNLLPEDKLSSRYVGKLQEAVDEYVKEFPELNDGMRWTILEKIMMQEYEPPNGGFPVWHCERNSISGRVLVFMTYLNDVNDGGTTDFKYQKISVKPEKGLTLIWPVDWMYTHRGNTSPTEIKRIVTGWFSYEE